MLINFKKILFFLICCFILFNNKTTVLAQCSITPGPECSSSNSTIYYFLHANQSACPVGSHFFREMIASGVPIGEICGCYFNTNQPIPTTGQNCVLCKSDSNNQLLAGYYGCVSYCKGASYTTVGNYCGNSCVCDQNMKNQGLCSVIGQTITPTCYRVRVSEGACPGGGGNCTTCNLSGLKVNHQGTDYACNMYSVEDATVTIGNTFNLLYTYNGTGSGYPYERMTLAREIAGGGSATLLSCLNSEDATECGYFSNTFSELSCPSTPGTYDFKLACNPESSSGQACSADILPYFRCRVKCVAPPPPQAPSVGFIKFYHPRTGIIKLNLISATDAIARRFGTVKVARWAGDKEAAADLGETKPLDPLYSPVRIFTGLGGSAGVKTWKRLP